MSNCVRVSLLGWVLFATPVASQELPLIPDSTRIRIWAPALELTKAQARFLAWNDSTVSILRVDEGELEVPFSMVTRLDGHSPGSVAGGVVKGLFAGAGVGALTGLAVGYLASRGSAEDGMAMIIFPILGIGVGGVSGTVFGASRAYYHYEPYRLPPELGFPEAGPEEAGSGGSGGRALVLAGVAAVGTLLFLIG